MAKWGHPIAKAFIIYFIGHDEHTKDLLGFHETEMCRIFPFLLYAISANSLCNLVAITINRYILMCHNTSYNQIYTRKYVTLMITIIWLFSFGMPSLSLFEIWGRFGLCEPSHWCTLLPKDGKSPLKFFMIIAFIIPCIVIIISNIAIYLKRWENVVNQLISRKRN